MQQEEANLRALMVMVNKFSGCRINPDYFSIMFKSPLIKESLNYIYILDHNQKLNPEDIQYIKKIFQDNFCFFSKQYNKE